MARDAGENSKARPWFAFAVGGFAGRSFTGTRHTELVKRKSNGKAIWIRTMKKKAATRSRFAICIDNSHYPASLDLHKVYRVLADADAAKDGDLRVIDESGEDYLYPADYFV